MEILDISALSNVLSHYDPAVRLKFNNFIVKILTPVADRLGWEAKPNEGLFGKLCIFRK